MSYSMTIAAKKAVRWNTGPSDQTDDIVCGLPLDAVCGPHISHYGLYTKLNDGPHSVSQFDPKNQCPADHHGRYCQSAYPILSILNTQPALNPCIGFSLFRVDGPSLAARLVLERVQIYRRRVPASSCVSFFSQQYPLDCPETFQVESGG